jgi:hypothetical protein
MNISFTRRLFVSDGPQSGVKFTFLDYVALGFILPGAEEFLRRGKEGWPIWISGFALGLIVLSFRDRSPQLTAWFRRRFRRSKTVDAPALSLASPVQKSLAKPQHNVQFVGFDLIHDDLYQLTCLHFQNVPNNGKLLGKFLHPRLQVIYYDHTTGLEIDGLYAVHWHDDVEGIYDISAAGRSAVLAMFTDKWMVGGEDNPASSKFFGDDDRPSDVRRSIVLPFGELRIVATLFGNYIDSPAVTVTGVLTLGTDGNASFIPDKGVIKAI